MASTIQITEYNVSPRTGFLLENALEYLPEYFEPWNCLAKNMADLVEQHRMRKAVNELQQLDESKLTNYRQQRLAHLQLVIITSGYVWEEGDQGVVQRLPKCIAIPLWNLSKQLGIKPVICHPDICLANWRFPENNQSVEVIYLIPGGANADWFFKVTCFVELAFAGGLQTMQNILDGVAAGDVRKVGTNLTDLLGVIENMLSQLKKMHENLSADVFYNLMRPYLGGWGGDGNPLPDGLIYEGISEDPVKCNGGSAAQSTTLQFLDILLGVKHSADKERFLKEMRNYMPLSHRQLLEDLEVVPRTLSHMVTSSEDEDLRTVYNKCLKALTEFRNYHIQIVTKYVLVPASKNRNSYESLSNKGTGGTDLLPFLKEIRDDTANNTC